MLFMVLGFSFQVIFRMYIDGFPEDRNIVLSHANNFINNIMLVVHFEMTLV